MLKQGCAACQGGLYQQESGIFVPFRLGCHTGFFGQGSVSGLAFYGLSASDKRDAVRDTFVLRGT